MTNTYQEARSWLDEHKDEFAAEFQQLSEGYIRKNDLKYNIKWQSYPEFYKWRLFLDVFRPEADTERFSLVQIALHMFQKPGARQDPAHTSDRLVPLLDELRAFRDTVAIPAKEYINEDVRNLNLLSHEANEEESKSKKQDAEQLGID